MKWAKQTIPPFHCEPAGKPICLAAHCHKNGTRHLRLLRFCEEETLPFGREQSTFSAQSLENSLIMSLSLCRDERHRPAAFQRTAIDSWSSLCQSSQTLSGLFHAVVDVEGFEGKYQGRRFSANVPNTCEIISEPQRRSFSGCSLLLCAVLTMPRWQTTMPEEAMYRNVICGFCSWKHMEQGTNFTLRQSQMPIPFFWNCCLLSS